MFNHLFNCAILTISTKVFYSIKVQVCTLLNDLPHGIDWFDMVGDIDWFWVWTIWLTEQSFIPCLLHTSLKECVRRFKWDHVFEKAREIKVFTPYTIQVFLNWMFTVKAIFLYPTTLLSSLINLSLDSLGFSV